MPNRQHRYEVISVSLPRNLLDRANEVIPKTGRSRVIAAVLTTFLDSISQRKLAEEYTSYYARRPAREAKAESELLAEWELSDAEAWAILDKEAQRGRRSPR